MPFMIEAEAGRGLAKALKRYEDSEAVVLALPRGGVPIAAVVARALPAGPRFRAKDRRSVFSRNSRTGAIADAVDYHRAQRGRYRLHRRQRGRV